MERDQAKDFDQGLLDLYDEFAHGRVSRREFVRRDAAVFAVAGMTAEVLLERLSPNDALAQQVMPDDARTQAEYVTDESPQGGKIKGLLARPKADDGKSSAVLVIHENRGLNPCIADVARRLAVRGVPGARTRRIEPAGRIPGQ